MKKSFQWILNHLHHGMSWAWGRFHHALTWLGSLLSHALGWSWNSLSHASRWLWNHSCSTFGWLWTHFRYRPKGRIHHWVLGRSWLALLVLYLVCWLGLAASFARLYQHYGGVWDGSIEPNGGYTTDYGHLLYFSVITQATVGYGDMAPRGHECRRLAAFQATLGTLCIGIGFGLIVLKLVERRHNLIFAKEVCYDPQLHQFVIWAWNKDAYALLDLHHTLGLQKLVPLEEDPIVRVKRYPLQVYKHQTIIPSMLGIIIKTTCDGINPASPPAASPTAPNPVSVVTKDDRRMALLFVDGKLYVEIRAVVAESQRQVLFQHTYTMEEIACGRFMELSDGPFPENWHYRRFERFGKMVYTQPEDCAKCSLHAECPLKPARQYRGKRKGDIVD